MSRDDEIAAALRPTFAREATVLAERIEEASEAGRRDDLRRLAHRLIGSAGTVRENGLVAASRELEQVAADETVDDAALAARAGALAAAVRVLVRAIESGTPRALATGAHETVAPAVVVAIEDSPANLALLRRIFDGIEGARLLTAETGRDGARLAVEHAAALVLLDLNLPDVPGEWVLDALRRPDGTTVTRVVVSADVTPGQEEQARRLGAADFVAKPYDIARLRAVVMDACRLG